MKYLYLWNWRSFSKDIKPLFYRRIVTEVLKLNYITKYKLIEKKIVKQNCKLVKFIVEDENKLKEYLKWNKDFIEWTE